MKCDCGEYAVKKLRDIELCRECYIERVEKDIEIQKEMVRYERQIKGHSNGQGKKRQSIK